jgi:hypothetical protein
MLPVNSPHSLEHPRRTSQHQLQRRNQYPYQPEEYSIQRLDEYQRQVQENSTDFEASSPGQQASAYCDDDKCNVLYASARFSPTIPHVRQQHVSYAHPQALLYTSSVSQSTSETPCVDQLDIYSPVVGSSGPAIPTSFSYRNAPIASQSFVHLSRAQRQEHAEVKKRIDLIRTFEMTKLEFNARTAVKMNLRGRARLEKWLKAASMDTRRAITFVATAFRMDNDILSDLPEERSRAMLRMTNDKLRLCDALMKRVTTRDGRFKWTLMFLLDDRLRTLEDPSRANRNPSMSPAAVEQFAKDSSLQHW